jgi:hypothetical protein
MTYRLSRGTGGCCSAWALYLVWNVLNTISIQNRL